MQPEEKQQVEKRLRSKWIYFGVAAISAFMGTLDSSIVNVALPTIAEEFNSDVKTVAWVAQAYILGMTALLLVGGRLLDIWGERKLFTIGFILFTLGSAMCAFSLSIHMLIFSRAFQALGGAVLMSSNQGLIAKSFPAKQRGRMLGVIGTVVSIGLASGPPLGGFLVDTLGWRAIFWINIPIGLIAIIYSIRTLAHNPSSEAGYKFDYHGSILLAIGLTALFLGFNFGPDYGWASLRVIGLVALAVVLLGLFFLNETRVSNPLLKLQLFSNRYFAQSCACAFLAFVALMSNSILMPFYLQNARMFSPQSVGLFMMTVPLSMLLAAPLAGYLSDLIGTRIPSTFGLAILGSGLYLLSTMDLQTATHQIVLFMAMLGIGMGIFSSPNSNAILSSVPRRFVGTASGLTAMMRTSGITFGLALSVTLYTFFRQDAEAAGTTAEQLLYLAGIQPAFAMASIIAGINLILSATRGKRPKLD
jgi:EmrB/QacA subfamily drug resistance transporter